MNFTAIVLSPEPYTRKWPFPVYNHVCGSGLNAAQLHEARLESVKHVDTEWCFPLDSDDDLPDDFLDVLQEAVTVGHRKNAALVYTDELIRTPDGAERLSVAGPYDRMEYKKRGGSIHHLAMMRTNRAKHASYLLPRGMHVTEVILYYTLAEQGVQYLPRVGYIWNKAHGMHSRPDTMISSTFSQRWCFEH